MAYSYEALFEDLTGATGYSVLDVQLAADTTRETVTELQVLAGAPTPKARGSNPAAPYMMIFSFAKIITVSVSAKQQPREPCGCPGECQ